MTEIDKKRMDEILTTIDNLRKGLADAVRDVERTHNYDLFSEKLTRWEKRACGVLEALGLTNEAERLRVASKNFEYGEPPGVFVRRAQSKDAILETLREDLVANPGIALKELSEQGRASSPSGSARPVFLGHGCSALWSREQLHLEHDCGLEVAAWESQSRSGFHTLDVLKDLLDKCGFAILVVTAEDATAEGHLRARQNVVHEIGLFQGRLGFEKVALLVQNGVEEFSNIAGLQHIQFSAAEVAQSFYELDRMLRREGIMS